MIKNKPCSIRINKNERLERSHSFKHIKTNSNSMLDEIELKYNCFNKLNFDVTFKGEKSNIEITADGILKLYKIKKVMGNND